MTHNPYQRRKRFFYIHTFFTYVTYIFQRSQEFISIQQEKVQWPKAEEINFIALKNVKICVYCLCALLLKLLLNKSTYTAVMKINNAPGKNTKDWLTCVESILLWKKPKSGTRGRSVIFIGQKENDFSLSYFPAAQRIDLILIII